MPPVNPIREIVEKFVAQPNDLDAFVSAFSSASLNIHKQGDPASIKLADQVEGCLADVRAGFASLVDLHKSLRELLAPAPVGYYFAQISAFSQSVNQPAVVEKGFPAASSGTSPAGAPWSGHPVLA
jgi:hypothetical protein